MAGRSRDKGIVKGRVSRKIVVDKRAWSRLSFVFVLRRHVLCLGDGFAEFMAQGMTFTSLRRVHEHGITLAS